MEGIIPWQKPQTDLVTLSDLAIRYCWLLLLFEVINLLFVVNHRWPSHNFTDQQEKKEMLWSPPTGWGWLDSDLRGERRQPPAQPHLVEGGQHLRQLLRAQRLRHRDQHLDLPGAGERGPRHQVCVPGLQHKLHAPSLPGGSHKPQL